MLDDLLGLGSLFDWLTPLWSTVQDLAHGGGHTFTIEQDGGAGYTGRQVERILKRAGCKTWGLQLVWPGDALLVSVPKGQAWLGWQALTQAGVTPSNGAPARRAR